MTSNQIWLKNLSSTEYTVHVFWGITRELEKLEFQNPAFAGEDN